eukprot:g4987.t1
MKSAKPKSGRTRTITGMTDLLETRPLSHVSFHAHPQDLAKAGTILLPKPNLGFISKWEGYVSEFAPKRTNSTPLMNIAMLELGRSDDLLPPDHECFYRRRNNYMSTRRRMSKRGLAAPLAALVVSTLVALRPGMVYGAVGDHFTYSGANGDKFEVDIIDGREHFIHNFANGNKLEGDVQSGTGHAKLTFANGDEIESDVKDNKPNGHEIITFANGDKCERNVKDGKHNGHESWTFANGDSCECNVKDGKLNGHFIYAYANGDKEEGDYKDGRRDGNVIRTHATGNKLLRI